MRNKYLDYLRGIGILWVITTHSVSVISSLLPVGPLALHLAYVIPFEMPIFFFASGASLYHAHSRKPSIGKYLSSRLSRLMGPYLLLAAICCGLFYGGQLSAGRSLTLDQLFSWLVLGVGPTLPIYVSLYIWFVRVALAVSLMHVVLIRCFHSDRYRSPMVAFLMVTFLLLARVDTVPFEFPSVPLSHLPQHMVFYAAFLYLGYYYASGRLNLGTRRLALVGIACGSAWIILLRAGAVSPNINLGKFPPNLGYALFGVNLLALWLVLEPVIVNLGDRLPRLARAVTYIGTNSYTFYLYHGFGLWAFSLVLLQVRSYGWHEVTYSPIWIVACVLSTLLITTLFKRTGDRLLQTMSAGRALSRRVSGRYASVGAVSE